jgi:hypothetical protein
VRGKGLFLKQFQARKVSGWRRPVGWIASYAVVLQLLAGALAGASLSAQAAGENWSFLEICYGKGAPAGELPGGIPAKHTSKCAACTLASAGAAALTPESIEFAVPAFAERPIVWTPMRRIIARAELSYSQQQRAPPIAA